MSKNVEYEEGSKWGGHFTLDRLKSPELSMYLYDNVPTDPTGKKEGYLIKEADLLRRQVSNIQPAKTY